MGLILVLISKTSNSTEALFYLRKTLEHGWSRAVLTHQIEGNLYRREGKAVTNFKATLPQPQSDLALQTIKDPYNFDFLTLRAKHDEKELEDALVSHVARFLLELGSGFSYLGQQYKLTVGGDDFYLDLLFYHVQLHCYILICKSKNKTVVEYTLKDVNNPIGVSEYSLTQSLPDEYKSSLPSIEEIEAELGES